ncbi:hypothetical protein BV22DRAFT_983437, partial [Leucogyrophana mollusca]
EVFKIPRGLLEDPELSKQLSRMVTDMLSSLRGNIKQRLTASAVKDLNIVEASKSLAHGCIEVDSSHWHRFAYLHVPLKKLYSPTLVPSLHKDLRDKVGKRLNIDVEAIWNEMNEGGVADD